MMTEKSALVAFCCAWVTLGVALVPRVSPDDAGIVPWLWTAAVPVAFWLGQRWAERGWLMARWLTGLAFCLGLGLALGLGLGVGLGAGTIHPNDLASLLALILPWWAVAACIRLPDRPRLDAPRLGARVLALGIAAALVWTGSRGGLTAALVGTLSALVLASRRRRLALLSLLLALTFAAAILPSTSGTQFHDSARAWIRDHDAEGFTWRHLASGRPMIWRQASHIVADFPLFGTGLGSYGALVPDVYVPPIRRIDLYDPATPRTPRVDDAHNLYLQSAVAFGLPFLLAFLGLCGLGVETRLSAALRSRDPGESSTRIASAAAFGGMLAYLLHGLVDCAAPGTVVYMAGWMALGHACTPPRRDTTRTSAWRPVLVISLLLLVPIVPAVRWQEAERLHHRAVGAVVSSEGQPLFSEDPSCRDAWWRERLAVARNDSSTQSAATVARCVPERIPEIATLSPTDAERAATVLKVQPRHPDALRWSLWTQPPDPAASLATGYFQHFALRPYDADAKMEFLRRVERAWLEAHPRLVLALLAHACAHGDPGANACYGAGSLARELDLGDEVADSFFLASEWPRARQQASENAKSDS